MRYAIIKNGVVENVILWDGDESYPPAESETIVEVTGDVGPGWAYTDGEFSAPEQEIPTAPESDPTVVAAQEAAMQQLIALGVSEDNARLIVGLPPL